MTLIIIDASIICCPSPSEKTIRLKDAPAYCGLTLVGKEFYLGEILCNVKWPKDSNEFWGWSSFVAEYRGGKESEP
jgi:hypothetical protein